MMKQLKLCSVALLLPAMVACVAPNQVLPHHSYTDTAEFNANRETLPVVLDQLTAPLIHREEVGVINITLQGSSLSQSAKQEIESHLSNKLLMQVELEHTPGVEETMQGDIEVNFVPDTCRYNKSAVPVTPQACQQLRNQYVSASNKVAWHQGNTYQEHNTALSTGAVQRLYNNQIKSAEKQSVTGED
ncbi:pilus assembly protein FlpD [Vibrio sp. SCSIO 43132]|uniref:pilus assembly protein FlpD n=1 Tax=Vibrio sp. SCSIO 43132 TaxID=2779363 RepID=UPI001CA8F9C7|nr:pilus assembly protein FlpD [Vibrio sp. SCSIO 43132]UAB70246.1 pilus assembly protein FlpD [Vibrio sp. SCSIO 43132]